MKIKVEYGKVMKNNRTRAALQCTFELLYFGNAGLLVCGERGKYY